MLTREDLDTRRRAAIANRQAPNFLGVQRSRGKSTGQVGPNGIIASRFITEEVMEGGEAVPGMEIQNADKYGFENPKEHFRLTRMEADPIARLWGVPKHCMDNWIRRYDLKTRKEAHLASLNADQSYSAADMKDAQERWLADRCKTTDDFIASCMNRIRAHEEGKDPLTPNGFQALAAAIKTMTELKSTAMQLPTRITAQFSTSHHTREQVKQSVVATPPTLHPESKFDVQEIDPDDNKALPSPEDAVEGEVEEADLSEYYVTVE